jgi:hypothetical protein
MSRVTWCRFEICLCRILTGSQVEFGDDCRYSNSTLVAMASRSSGSVLNSIVDSSKFKSRIKVVRLSNGDTVKPVVG